MLHEARQDVIVLQQEDLVLFGKLVLALCCNNVAAFNNLPKSLDNLSRHYSQDLKNVVLFLLTKPGLHKVSVVVTGMGRNGSLSNLDHTAVIRHDRLICGR